MTCHPDTEPNLSRLVPERRLYLPYISRVLEVKQKRERLAAGEKHAAGVYGYTCTLRGNSDGASGQAT